MNEHAPLTHNVPREVRAWRGAMLVVAGVAVALAFSRHPLRWYVRGGLFLVGFCAGAALLAGRRAGQTDWVGYFAALAWFLVWSLIASAGVHYLRSSALPYFAWDPGWFGEMWPRRGWVIAHIAGGMTALVLGPLQFWPGLRGRALRLHRALGTTYVAGVALAGASAFQLARFIPSREGGARTGLSMAVLALAWLFATGAGVRAVAHGDFPAHRRWMIRSYALTLAFVTLRWMLDLPLLFRLGPAEAVIPAVVWAAWLLPLAAVELTRAFSPFRRVPSPQ